MKINIILKSGGNISLLLFFFVTSIVSAQSVSIVDYLKRIERGEAEAVRKEIPVLFKENRDNPSVLFLDAVLTEAGDKALEKYKFIYQKFPRFPYSDAVLYRIFSYYFALGYYKTAEDYLSKLKSEFPSSPYLKIADRSIPEEEIAEVSVIEKPEREKEQIYKEVESIPLPSSAFTVQAGAFLNFKNAERLKSRFEKAGYYSSIYPKEVGGSILNVVIVGKFNDKEDAVKFLPKLKSKFKLNGRVLPLK